MYFEVGNLIVLALTLTRIVIVCQTMQYAKWWWWGVPDIGIELTIKLPKHGLLRWMYTCGGREGSAIWYPQND